jgi:hypothetical protein
MRAKRIVVACVGLLALVCVPRTADAQAKNEDQCKAVLQKEFPDVLKDPENAKGFFCKQLAGQLYTIITKGPMDKVFSTGALRVGDVFSQRDVQNRKTQQASPGGTPAQGEALPTVQPAGVAAGTIAALGTRAGQDAIAALSVNPFVLFLANEASRQLARGSRLADVTVYIPISSVNQATTPAADPNELRYVGARVRFNYSGISSGDEVWRNAEELLKQQAREGALYLARLEEVLGRVPDVQKCADALKPDAPALAPGTTPPCDSLDVGWNLSDEVALKLRQELASIRRQADSKYLGIDFRYDFGDPTLGTVENAAGKFLFAGIAAGRRWDDGRRRTTVGIRGRLGLRHSDLDLAGVESTFGAEGGVGFEVARMLDDDSEVNVSGAVEFRRGGEGISADLFQTDFTMLRGTISLPVTKANSISINVGKPITGDVSPIFSVNFNWGLLLSDLVGRRGI